MTLDIAALDVAVAIGAQAGGLRGVNSQLVRSLFSRAQRFAFEGMLTKQSLGQVRLFLLMGFYMLGACQRNAASMYLSVAAEAAAVVGLNHSASYNGLQSDEWSIR